MGLDQYAYALQQRPEKPVDFELDVRADLDYPACFREDPVFGELFVTKPGTEAVACWRKHPDLHGFIREIYRAKGGSDWHWDEFSGPVLLDRDDIDAIEAATLAGELPHTTGFFFGESTPEDKELTLEFCRRAREYLDRQWVVAYDSSW